MLPKERASDNEGKQPEIEMMMPLENFAGKYSNYMRIGHTASEFILDFFLQTGPQANNVARIIISSLNIKDFTKVLQDNISVYEETFKIVLPESSVRFLEEGIGKKA